MLNRISSFLFSSFFVYKVNQPFQKSYLVRFISLKLLLLKLAFFANGIIRSKHIKNLKIIFKYLKVH